MITERPLVSHRLAEDAYGMLEALQHERGSNTEPSTARALRAVLERAEGLLNSDPTSTDRRYFLSSLDPGKGKTEAVCMFLRAWKSQGFSGGNGVLIALSRREEIRSLIERAGLESDDYAVLVESKHELTNWGLGEKSEAPVLFTTQAMVRSRCRGARSFEDLGCFQYLGRPRSCRIWDEAMVPAEPVALRLDTLKRFLEPLRPAAPATAEHLEAFIMQAEDAPAGAMVRVPLALGQVRGLPAFDGDLQERCASLSSLAGQEALVAQSNRYGTELVAAQDRLPEDFAPAIILDASGRVRHTYKAWEEAEANLVRLPSAANDYRNLTINHWHQAASRSALTKQDHRARVLSVVASLINASTEDEWLIIHHMARGDLDIEGELNKLLEGDRSKVSFLHWGNHHGTNAFREIGKVVVLGPWSYPQSLYLGHLLASGVGVDGGSCQAERDAATRRIRDGEHQHHLLQAICRTSVRNSSGGICGHCEAYVVGKLGANGKALLADTFPGANIVCWKPEGVSLRGQAMQMAALLVERFSRPGVTSLRKAELGVAMGLKGSKGLAQVLKRDDVRAWMAEHQLKATTREIVRLAA